MNPRALPSARSRQLLAAIVAFALVSVFVIRTSDAAFTATATNAGNQFTTGSITLSADLTVPMFGAVPGAITDATGLKPGDVVESCIEISYDDTLQNTSVDEVTLTSSVGNSSALAANLDVDVYLVDDCETPTTSAESVSGTLESFGVPAAGTGWTPSASGETQAFQFRVEVLEGASTNASVSNVTFTWSVTTSS